MSKNKNVKKTNFSSIIVLFGILVIIFYIAAIMYYYQQFLFYPEKTKQYQTNLLIDRINQLEKNQQTQESDAQNDNKPQNIKELNTNIKPSQAENIISSQSNKIIDLLENKNFSELSKLIHPEKGVRFSPYSYIKESDLIFTKEELKNFSGENFWQEKEKYLWGNYDGSGKPITLTFSEYYNKFIYDKYYSRADYVLYNQSISYGNTINNVVDFYNNPIVVEYYMDPIEPQYEGLDWSALRLVYEQYEGSWYLVGIIHDQWTI